MQSPRACAAVHRREAEGLSAQASTWRRQTRGTARAGASSCETDTTKTVPPTWGYRSESGKDRRTSSLLCWYLGRFLVPFGFLRCPSHPHPDETLKLRGHHAGHRQIVVLLTKWTWGARLLSILGLKPVSCDNAVSTRNRCSSI